MEARKGLVDKGYLLPWSESVTGLSPDVFYANQHLSNRPICRRTGMNSTEISHRWYWIIGVSWLLVTVLGWLNSPIDQHDQPTAVVDP